MATLPFVVRILLVFTILSLTSCAADNASRYHPVDETGGYINSKLQEGMYRVSFGGNAYDDEIASSDYALLRSAEVTLEGGYKYFTVLQHDTKSFAYVEYVCYITEDRI